MTAYRCSSLQITLRNDCDFLFFSHQVSFLILIILEGLLRFILFLECRALPRDLRSCTAGAFSCSLGVICITLLLLSESLRSSTYGSFGSRAAAGLGSIEPLTSIIILRFFSTVVGNHL
jgi:hypothetical protein